MEIKHLKELQENPKMYGYPGIINKPLTESEISRLEQLYNDGKQFPLALKELLFLAGDLCYVLEYGTHDSQRELQDYVRQILMEENKEITDPYLVIDIYGGSQFLFVYLNQGDDPIVYIARYFDKTNWIKALSYTISEYISVSIERTKQGRNPF
ncbi:hypothetical protein AM493_20300 [Flavobacterium akiainvivens]|uniref:Knr4/Smi1-like domain-containing protein n=1 Tax=Flavobacterium akiainvivens TaxID=1202724 RepID=A0A0M8MLA3_9FLAO|nr:SMI1/KNR4 family protein [Flavobacterium akiainvivens]KOS08127.1 hypothetical protein AM493_20300 [Flavobacterium akiainvivens]SFQ72132.1 hypothetical protein SAMN05444144_11768 [Flavobacterium akiainvivens]